jgi:hypothetical protein
MAQIGAAVNPQEQLAAFREALGRIGFSPLAQDALNHNGFNAMYNLMIYSKDQIKRVCTVIREDTLNPVPISMEQEQLLTAMRNWVKTRVRTNRDINPALFTRDVAIAEAIKMVNIAEEVQSEKESDVKMPEKFKITSKWIIFSESVDTYLNRLRGQGRIPLNYVIRSVETPIPGTQYETEQEMLIATAPLTGHQFDIDNERVYGVIKQLILDGPGWSYITNTIDRAKNGRQAWLALRAHYEGESFLNKQKEETYKVIEGIHYKGERTNFTFEHFTAILTKGYNDLQRYGEPVIETKKVRDLLSKISDPKLESAKQAIRINPQYKNNFDLAVNFLAESVEIIDRSKPRVIGEAQSHTPSTQGRGGRHNYQAGQNGGRTGRGRGHNAKSGPGGRGHGGYGRGGRGRGRGRHNESTTSSYIPRSEWNAMTPLQRQTLLQARATSRINALASTVTPSDDVSAITTPTGIQVPAQVAQVQRDQLTAQQTSTSATVTSGPFGGRASHRG